MNLRVTVSALLLLTGCARLELDPPTSRAYLVYDPGNSEIPLPNDAVLDAEAGHLDLPVDDDMSPAEQTVRTWMNTLDAWSTATPISLSFSEPIDPDTLDDGITIWEWGITPTPVELPFTVEGDEVTIDAPDTGWRPGGNYVVLVRDGRDGGVLTVDGDPVSADAAMTYLRQPEPIDGIEHNRAFPGDTRAERLEAAEALEAIRKGIDPYLADLEQREGLSRDAVAGFFTFSVTQKTELAMDSASQRMPLPFDLLIDPETGRVDLPPSATDDELETDAKLQAAKLDGFGVSSDMLFELTGPVDPLTVEGSVTLWDLSVTPVEVPANVRAMSEDGDCGPSDTDCTHLVVSLPHEVLPLSQGTTYALVVSDSLKALDGTDLVPMTIGHLMTNPHPLAAGGQSLLSSLDTDDAERLEGVRARVSALLDDLGRDHIVTAWPFTTLNAEPRLREIARIPDTLGFDIEPRVSWRKPAYDLFGDDALEELFPGALNPGPVLYLGRANGVAEVVEGTLPVPYFLDPVTRRWNDNDAYEIRDVSFWASIPENFDPNKPVVIFGHPITADRRFQIMMAGALAREGYAVVTIDFPFHGDRMACVDGSLVAVPNFLPEDLRQLTGFTDNLLWFPPCASGQSARCSPEGECLTASGAPDDFTEFPIMQYYPVSGAAFLDVDDMPHINEHFAQALVDLSALRYSLQTADWTPVFGQAHRRDTFHYTGQSLGAIIGSVWVAVTPEVDRAVLNVPGANMVELFRDSTFFGPQIDAFLDDLEVEHDSFEEARLMAIAHWLIDSVDPHSVGHLYAEEQRSGLIQIDRINDDLGDLVIPNHTTDTLQQVSGLPMVEYPSVLHGDLVIPGVGDAQLADMVDFLNGEGVAP